MGVNAASLGFLKYCASKSKFADTVSLGRQGYYISEADKPYLATLNFQEAMDFKEEYCDKALKKLFGATQVDSIDNSPFEGASHIFDLNEVQAFDRQYDTVLDIGTTEHALNVLNAFFNMQRLCKVGGQVIHVAPANNFCGHGFWQFSPELFFHLYSIENGFKDIEVFLCETKRPRHWFKVKTPSGNQRAEALSSKRLYVLVRAQKAEEKDLTISFQTDYMNRWEDHSEGTLEKASSKTEATQNPFKKTHMYQILYPYYWLAVRPSVQFVRFVRRQYSQRLNSSNRSLTQIKVSDYLDKR